MGTFCLSIHVRDANRDDVVTAVSGLIGRVRAEEEDAGAATALIATNENGWLTIYPNDSLWGQSFLDGLHEGVLAGHVLVFSVHDSDVLQYWYFRDGERLDYYNSCPDYFGTEDESEVEAAGDAEAFAPLLGERARREWAEAIACRLIGGEPTGKGPEFDFEDHRLAVLSDILGLIGTASSFEYLEQGENIEGMGGIDSMERLS